MASFLFESAPNAVILPLSVVANLWTIKFRFDSFAVLLRHIVNGDSAQLYLQRQKFSIRITVRASSKLQDALVWSATVQLNLDFSSGISTLLFRLFGIINVLLAIVNLHETVSK